jgi:quercetin dioxygenase-like cupin family protein
MGERIHEDRDYALGQHLKVKVLTRGAETGGRHDMLTGSLPAGSQTPLHVHTRYEERVYVLRGSTNVWVGNDHFTTAKGDFYTIPLNVPHMVESGPEGAELIVVTSPAAFVELIERTGTPAHMMTNDTEFDMNLFAEVCGELGDKLLGPPGMLPSQLG